ncbi:MAG: hypothetical protein DRG24_05880 [Epsilonproteobacteria bacterium]|nr:MAG: hypothetical protein DRG24_05880 [Campylobacterota bacterium]
MPYMFYYAFTFDRDISRWCISRITTKPNNFDKGSAFADETAKQLGALQR